MHIVLFPKVYIYTATVCLKQRDLIQATSLLKQQVMPLTEYYSFCHPQMHMLTAVMLRASCCDHQAFFVRQTCVVNIFYKEHFLPTPHANFNII